MTNMELIQIIYNVLLASGLLLMLVVVVSFFLSRICKKKVANSIKKIPHLSVPIITSSHLKNEQRNYRNKIVTHTPNVFQIDPMANRELKILRKPTVTKMENQERIWQEERALYRTNTSRKRYTIVNEELKRNCKPNVINF